MSYTPKVGDRVRATDIREGVVTKVEFDAAWIETKGGQTALVLNVSDTTLESRTFEKLQDPEPQWVNGDVIKVGGWLPAYRVKGDWVAAKFGCQHYMLSADPDIVSKSWRSGNLDILYKADAQADAA